MRKKFISETTRSLMIDVICYLLILLFFYAAISKLSDYQKFRVQLGQSPLLTLYAGLIAWTIPSIEILLAVCLAVPVARLTALYGSFTLMTMFSFYIFVITHYSNFVPCSCGGILEKMSWDQHLIFNLVFVLISATGILLVEQNKTVQAKSSTQPNYHNSLQYNMSRPS